MTQNPIIERIRAEAPSLVNFPARRRFLGMVAIELGGARAAGLPGDDHARPPRWTIAPAYTMRGLEHMARTRRPIELLEATQRAAYTLSQEPKHFGHDPARWERAAQELEKQADLMKVSNQGEE